jgi:hypothetical protein
LQRNHNLMYSMRQNIQYWNSCISNAHVHLSAGHSSGRTCSQYCKGSCVVQLLGMGLSTEEKVLIVEYYFRSYGSGHEGGPSLKKVREQFWERFNKTAPSNTVMLSVVTKFRRSGSVLCQRKGKCGRPVTVSIKENHAHVLRQVLHSPWRSPRWTALKLNVSDTSICWLFKDIGGFPYQIQVGQRLTEQARMVYCGTFLAMVYENPDFLRKMCGSPTKVTFTWTTTWIARQFASLVLSGQMLTSRNRYTVHVWWY